MFIGVISCLKILKFLKGFCPLFFVIADKTPRVETTAADITPTLTFRLSSFSFNDLEEFVL